MDDFNKILEMVDSEDVKFSVEIPKNLSERLILGQTRYVCRYGTLSDGHERITPAQRYYGAIKEMYTLGNSIQLEKAQALEAQAKILRATKAEAEATDEPSKLEAKAALIKANHMLTSSLVMVEDRMRMLDEYNKVRLELKDAVEAQYPLGAEQAEKDNWTAIFEYRMRKERVPGMAREHVHNIPLDPVTKAQLGYDYHRVDAIAPLELSNPDACKDLALQYEQHITKQLKEVN